MNKTKVMISGERQKPTQKAARRPCGVCGRGVGSNSIHCTRCQKWVCRFLCLVTLTFDPWPSNSSKQGTKHVFCVNLAQIHSAFPEIFHTQTKTRGQRCFPKHKQHARRWKGQKIKKCCFCLWWPWPSNSSKRGTKYVFRVNLAQIHSAVPEIFHIQRKNHRLMVPKTEPSAVQCVR